MAGDDLGLPSSFRLRPRPPPPPLLIAATLGHEGQISVEGRLELPHQRVDDLPIPHLRGPANIGDAQAELPSEPPKRGGRQRKEKSVHTFRRWDGQRRLQAACIAQVGHAGGEAAGCLEKREKHGERALKHWGVVFVSVIAGFVFPLTVME